MEDWGFQGLGIRDLSGLGLLHNTCGDQESLAAIQYQLVAVAYTVPTTYHWISKCVCCVTDTERNSIRHNGQSIARAGPETFWHINLLYGSVHSARSASYSYMHHPKRNVLPCLRYASRYGIGWKPGVIDRTERLQDGWIACCMLFQMSALSLSQHSN